MRAPTPPNKVLLLVMVLLQLLSACTNKAPVSYQLVCEGEGCTGSIASEAEGEGEPAEGEGEGEPGEGEGEGELNVPPGGYFVAAGYGGRVMRTTDHGQTWQADQADVPDGDDDEHLIRDLAWGGGTWLTAAGVNGRTKSSPDGVNWTTRAFEGWIGGLAYADGHFVAAGGNGWRGVSNDGGATWVELVDFQNHFRALALGQSNGHAQFVAVGDNGRVAIFDGQSWADENAGLAMADVDFGNGAFVAIAGNGSSQFVRSLDGGHSWSAGNFPAGATGITFGTDAFVAVGNGNAYTSTDGQTWVAHPQANLSGAIDYGDGVYLVVDGWSGRVFSSTNGTSFAELPSLASANAIVHVRYGGI